MAVRFEQENLVDSVNHELAREDTTGAVGTGSLRLAAKRDPRWVKIKRPFIVVGG